MKPAQYKLLKIGSIMKNKILSYSFILSFLFISCNSPSSNNNGPCSGPTIHSCSGTMCEYVHIFDANGNFIKEFSATLGGGLTIAWDGTDCHGNKVGCGKYTAKVYIVYNGQSTNQTSTFLITDSTSTHATGRSACDSLKSHSSGNYAETVTTSIGGGEDVGCVCCQ
jgi:hypothetical protein